MLLKFPFAHQNFDEEGLSRRIVTLSVKGASDVQNPGVGVKSKEAFVTIEDSVADFVVDSLVAINCSDYHIKM